MSASKEFRQFIEDCLSGLGEVRTRAMFGGAGVYLDGVMSALIADDVLYIKADAENQPDFEAAGSPPFIYQGKKKPIAMGYWRAPDDLLDSREEMATWAGKGLAAARRRQRAKG